MLKTPTVQADLDEYTRCREPSWLSLEVQDIDPATGVEMRLSGHDLDPVENGSIHPGQEVFSQDGQLVGQVTKIVSDFEGQNSHFIIRTRRFLGSQKIIPVEYVSSVDPKGISLSVTRDIFLGLPSYKSDAAITDDIDRAFWEDLMLRSTDYWHIDVRVKDGFVSLSGHVTSSRNKQLIENAIQNIQGILGLKIHLIADDVLVLKVAASLGQIEQTYGARFFTNVHQGVVYLSGEVNTLDIRCQAEQCAAGIPWVRGVINNVRAPGIDIETIDQRFFQPEIGQEIYFGDGLTGRTVKQVIMNPNNRRVTGMVVERRETDPLQEFKSFTESREPIVKRLVVIPVNAIHHLTSSAGYLHKNGHETGHYDNFDLTHFVVPNRGWVPPYPYCPVDVLFPAETICPNENEMNLTVPSIGVGITEGGAEGSKWKGNLWVNPR